MCLQPDLRWWAGGQCAFVGDCKYKRVPGPVPNADLYQLLAYLTALDLRDGLLMYAAGADVPAPATVRNSGRRLHVRTLDVTQSPKSCSLRWLDWGASYVGWRQLSRGRRPEPSGQRGKPPGALVTGCPGTPPARW